MNEQHHNEIPQEEFPEYLDTTKASYAQEYPKEDIEETDMFAPFFRRKRTWLVIVGLLLLAMALLFMPVNVQTHADSGLDPDKVRIGLGIFFCIAFLWLTEALPLAATALLVPILAVLTGVFDVKSALSSFAHPLIFIFFGGFALASAMAYQGVDRWIANRMVIMGKGSLLMVSALLFGVTAFLSMWMSNTATTAMMIPLVLGVLLVVSKPATKQSITVEKEGFTFNWHRITTLIIFAVTALCWIFSKQLSQLLHIGKYTDTLIALCAVIALLYFRVVRWRDIDRGTDWGVLFLFGGGLALSSVMKATGTSLFLARVFSDAVSGLPLILIIGAVIAFVIFLTELSSNTATAALFVPIFMVVSTQLGAQPSQLVIPLALAASCAFMLPIATPPNAIVFGTGRIPQRSMMRIGFVLNIVFVIALTLLSKLIF